MSSQLIEADSKKLTMFMAYKKCADMQNLDGKHYASCVLYHFPNKGRIVMQRSNNANANGIAAEPQALIA